MMVLAPRNRASLIAAVPTPDAAAVIITDSPLLNSAAVAIASCAVTKTLGIDAASAQDRESGIRINCAGFTATNSAYEPGARPITRSPTCQPVASGPASTISPANSTPPGIGFNAGLLERNIGRASSSPRLVP